MRKSINCEVEPLSCGTTNNITQNDNESGAVALGYFKIKNVTPPPTLRKYKILNLATAKRQGYGG